MNKSPEEIIKEIDDCKTIAQINKLYAFYFKMYIDLNDKIVEGFFSDVDLFELMQEKASIQIIFRSLVSKEEKIRKEIAVNN